MNRRRRNICLLLAVVWLTPVRAQSVFPGAEWQSIDSPESAGFSPRRLAAVREWVSSLDTTAVMVVVGGRVLFSHGDVTRLGYLASVRKSVLALLYGPPVANRTIALDRTLRDLKFTDVGGLLPRELDATIQHLLMARSGIYHPASNGGDNLAHAPPRASLAPGAKYLYNNWDFNAAGAVFEDLTGRNIYDALETDLARPLGMQDFERARQVKSGDLAASSRCVAGDGTIDRSFPTTGFSERQRWCRRSRKWTSRSRILRRPSIAGATATFGGSTMPRVHRIRSPEHSPHGGSAASTSPLCPSSTW
jgi:CubicO group peptidase (beta-lactamase class C family)